MSKKNIMMKSLTSWDDHLDKKYGKKGTQSRDKYEQGFETFKLGVMLEEARRKKRLTQEQLAEKCGTTKNYISRIENNNSDIRLSTLMRIITEGLGGQLKLTVDFRKINALQPTGVFAAKRAGGIKAKL
jgi:DNA-binding XRE family transcriptional regulator